MTDSTVILVNLRPTPESDYSKKGATYPATGLLIVGSMLRQIGVNVEFIDGAYDSAYLEELARRIESCDRLLFVGFSVMTPQIPIAVEASLFAKRIRQCITIWGGVHPTLFPEQVVTHPAVDIAVVNEALAVIPALVGALDAGEPLTSIPGIAYKTKDGLRINPGSASDTFRDLPPIDFSMLEMENYLSPQSGSVYQREFPAFTPRIRAIPILTGLGCPYKCSFCINVILARRYRYRSAESITAEIERSIETYEANTFFFLDEDFLVNRKRLLRLLSLWEERELRFNWRFWTRVDHLGEKRVDIDILRRLEKIGYGSLVMGAESGSQRILDSIQKSITVNQIRESLELLRETGIYPRYSFMVGLPGETMGEIEKTYALCLDLKKTHPATDIAGPFLFRLYPGSPLFDMVTDNHDMTIPTTLEQWDSLFLCNNETSKQVKWAPEIFRSKFELMDYYFRRAIETPSGRGIRRAFQSVFRLIAELRVRKSIWALPFLYLRHKLKQRKSHG